MEANTSIIVSDMGGVFYSFSPTFDPDEHMKLFDENVQWYSKNVEEFKNAAIEYEKGNYEQALQIEKLGINVWFSDGANVGALPVYFNEIGLRNLCQNAKKYKIVIISTSPAENSKLILQEGFKSIGEDSSVIDTFEIYNMSLYGSKKDSLAWGKILKQYHHISAVVEDNIKNLDAAFLAASEIDPKVKKYTEMVSL